jgi:phage baseplate assembly protein gpV
VSAALFESVARIARHEVSGRALPAVGKVTANFGADAVPPDHAVTVELRDSGLVLPNVPVAVGALGFAALPAVDDLVLVVFLAGDPNAPVVAGRLYTDTLAAPPEGKDGVIALGLPAGAQPAVDVVLDGAAPSIVAQVGSEPVKLTLDDQQVTVEIGKLKLSVTSAGGGRLELAAGGTEVTLKEDGDLALKTSGNLTLEGNEVQIKGSSKVKVTGGVVEVN